MYVLFDEYSKLARKIKGLLFSIKIIHIFCGIASSLSNNSKWLFMLTYFNNPALSIAE